MLVRELLETPAVAVALGFLVGVLLIGAAAWSRNLSASPDKRASIAIMMGFMMGGMLLATAILVGYVVIAPKGFLGFGLSLAAGFIAGLGVFAVLMVRQSHRDQQRER